jgi:hypothetical protein
MLVRPRALRSHGETEGTFKLGQLKESRETIYYGVGMGRRPQEECGTQSQSQQSCAHPSASRA